MAKFVSVLGKITSKLKRAFGARAKATPPKPNTRVVGHRGIAAGSLKRRQQLQAKGEQPYTQEEINRWHQLSGDEVFDFIHNQAPLFVNSSNVSMLQYFPDDRKLMVQFHGGKSGRLASYLYDNVTEHEALLFATGQSKGSLVWDLLRVRGSRTAHKKPYRKLAEQPIKPPQQPKPLLQVPNINDITLQQLLQMDPQIQQLQGMSESELIRLLNEELKRRPPQ